MRFLLTGYSDMDAAIAAINKGRIFYYCKKPWKKEELKMILLKGFDHYELTQSNRHLIAQLSKSVRELETFLYRASHDLRSPAGTSSLVKN
ncbi:MAG: hypothetical protein ACOYXT_21785 [Bacteroidota bacterium]